MNERSTINKVIAVLTFLFFVIGSSIGVHNYFAKATDLAEFKTITNRKFMHIDRRDLQKRLWELERVFNFDAITVPEPVRRERNELISDIDRMKQELDREAKEG